ncbi:MAG TPA: hypothetical protein VFY89_05220 [Ktedonobacterales bacterium]
MRQRGRTNRAQSVLLSLLALALAGALAACGGSTPADTPPPAADLLTITVTEHLAVPPPQPTQKVVFSQAFSDELDHYHRTGPSEASPSAR